MHQSLLLSRELRAYLALTSLVVCGMLGGLITAVKITHVGIDFPFSVAIVSLFTYPIIDCICELWGKKVARQTLWFGLFMQMLLTLYIQISIYVPHPDYWMLQPAYQSVLSMGLNVVIASLAAFSVSQVVDIVVYQKIKEVSGGKWLWMRSNISVYIGQIVDSFIFINVLFFNMPEKWSILAGMITIKIILSLLMTPVVYLIVLSVNRYLDNNTFAFKSADEIRLMSI